MELLSAIEARKKQNELNLGNEENNTTAEEPTNTNVTEMDNSELTLSSTSIDEIPEASFNQVHKDGSTYANQSTSYTTLTKEKSKTI